MMDVAAGDAAMHYGSRRFDYDSASMHLAARAPAVERRHEILAMSRSAVQELEEFAAVSTTSWKSSNALHTLCPIVLWFIRPLGFGRWFATGPGFWPSFARTYWWGGSHRHAAFNSQV